jgi:5-methyltetrahydrofolate--homocysteine methyltransferase
MKNPSRLREEMARRVIIADGAMGTMLQEAQPTLEDFQGHEGCNEILNVSMPELVKSVHRRYFEVGVDAVETNTFGANWANLAEYGIEDRIYELAFAGGKLAKEVADEFSTDDRPRWVFGSLGPGTKLPTLGHTEYQFLKQAYATASRGLLDSGVDALLIETAQDLLQAKAAINGARQAISDCERDVLLIAQVTVETTGTMLLGSEIGAALNALEPLGIDLIGLNCATGPAEMSEHLRTLSKSSSVGISVMPNAGLPLLGPDGARYPLSPDELATYLSDFVDSYGLILIGGCCGTTPEHLRAVVNKLDMRQTKKRNFIREVAASSLYQSVPFRQELTYMSIGERTNANGSRAFRDALLAQDWQSCIEIARDQIRDGAHMLDLSIDYVGRDGVADMKELASRLATSSTLPIVLDSTEPAVLRAGLEHLGGRSVINSVNYEDGDGPDSRFAKIMPLVREHGAAVVALTIDENGQARTSTWKVEVATRLIEDLTKNWGMNTGDILIDCLTFPIATGQEETRRDGIETLSAIAELKRKYPAVQTTLGVSNVSFGLNPAARVILNSVFLAEAVKVGLDSAIVHPSKITPTARIEPRQLEVAMDLIYDRRTFDQEGNCTYDPLSTYLELFDGVETKSSKITRAAELAALPLVERLQRRIIDGEKVGLEADLDEAVGSGISPLTIINEHLLSGMKTVGELFGSGQMQLPFVLQSAEVMKRAVAILEPLMEKTADDGKGSILLATVKGDVHDIGKNLVDIILSNNGYTTVNIGIKQTVNQIIDAATESKVDVIGLSGLLVKSTVVMKENLEELTSRGLADQWPVILGGAALTRSFVEQDLAGNFSGTVRYAKDAFEGLRLMDSMMAIKRGDKSVTLPPLRERRTPNTRNNREPNLDTTRSDVDLNNPLPEPPFYGSKIVKGIPLASYLNSLDERALFVGQWGLQGKRGEYEAMVESEGLPRLRSLLNEVKANGWLNAAVVYGYFPCYSEGNDLVILHHEGVNKGKERTRFTFPRQSRDRRLCLSDFFRSKESGEIDTVAFHIVTMGQSASEATSKLFAADAYREYLELHGLSVQLTEALAEHWHSRIREELGFSGEDSQNIAEILDQGYRGSRYSFGYPACPDLEQQVQLCELLEPERIGVELSQEFQLHPEQSTSAIIVHHPEAKYFNAT